MSGRSDAVATAAQAALGLAKRTTSGRMALAGAADAIVVDALPTALRAGARRELGAAREAAGGPLSAREVEKLLQAAWGRRPGSVLDALDLDSPIAVTPTAQVHRGVHDGADVAVKVLRPGLVEIVRADLVAAEALAGPIGAALPRTDVGALLAEVRERSLDELDLEHEADALRAYGRALRRVAPDVTVPRPVSDLAQPSVLVGAWVDGAPLADAAPSDPGAVARMLIEAVVGSAVEGIVHCDPTPANVLVDADGAVALVDLGASCRVDVERVTRTRDAVAALRDDDEAAFAAALGALGWLEDAPARRAFALAREVGAPFLAGPATLDAATLGAVADDAWARGEELAALGGELRLDPRDLWPLRMVGVLVGTLCTLGATEDWLGLALDALADV